MSEPESIGEIIRREFREKKEFSSPLVAEDSSSYQLYYKGFAEVVEAYFAPSYKQAHEDLHLWFDVCGKHTEFVLSDISSIASFFDYSGSTIADDLKEREFYIEASKNKLEHGSLVSKVILEKPMFGKVDYCYLLDYDVS